MSNNGINKKEGGKLLSDMIAQNSVLKELNIAGNCKYGSDDGPGFAKEFAVGLGTNGAMAKFTFSGMVGSREGPPVTVETSMTEADFSKKKLGASGAIMLAAFLPKCQ